MYRNSGCRARCRAQCSTSGYTRCHAGSRRAHHRASCCRRGCRTSTSCHHARRTACSRHSRSSHSCGTSCALTFHTRPLRWLCYSCCSRATHGAPTEHLTSCRLQQHSGRSLHPLPQLGIVWAPFELLLELHQDTVDLDKKVASSPTSSCRRRRRLLAFMCRRRWPRWPRWRRCW